MVQINHTAHVKNLIIYEKKKNSDYKIFCEPIHGIRQKETEPTRRKGRCRQAQDTEGPPDLSHRQQHGPAANQPPTPGLPGAGAALLTTPKGAMAHLTGFWQESDGAAWKLARRQEQRQRSHPKPGRALSGVRGAAAPGRRGHVNQPLLRNQSPQLRAQLAS